MTYPNKALTASEHWHGLYLAECLKRQDDAARYGQQIVDLDAQLAETRAAHADAIEQWKAAEGKLAEAKRLLKRYRTELHMGQQPYMICHEVDELLKEQK